MQPQFVTKPAFTVVGMLIHPTPMSPEIPALWDEFAPRIGEIEHIAEAGVSYGLMDHFDQESSVFDYMAGNPVTQVVDLPVGMTRWEVPTNNYAVFETTLDNIGETFDHIYSRWLPTSDYQQAPGPYFEHYPATFPDSPTLSIYIPVEKKKA